MGQLTYSKLGALALVSLLRINTETHFILYHLENTQHLSTVGYLLWFKRSLF